jgi:hypothetical protein
MVATAQFVAGWAKFGKAVSHRAASEFGRAERGIYAASIPDSRVALVILQRPAGMDDEAA